MGMGEAGVDVVEKEEGDRRLTLPCVEPERFPSRRTRFSIRTSHLTRIIGLNVDLLT